MNKKFEFCYSRELTTIFVLSAVFFNIIWLVICCHYPVDKMASFLLFTAISIILPGFTLSLFIKDRLNGMVRLSVSYALGYVCVVLEYFISELTNRRVSFTTLTVVVSVISLVVLLGILKKTKSITTIYNSHIDLIDSLIFVGVYLINIFAYSSNNLGLEIAPEFTTGRAIQYWANNSVALKISWPADNLFFLGDQLNYHYFSNIPIAFFSEICNISIFDLSFPLYSFTKSILLAGAVVYLFDSVGANNKIKAIGSFVLLCTAGIDSLTRVSLTSNLYRTPFGLDIGFAYGLLFIAQFYRQVLSDRLRVDYLLLTIAFWFMNIGAKAPLSMILIIPTGFMCITWLVQKKYKKAFGYGISILFTFLVISYVCVGLFNVTSGEAAWHLCLYSPEEIMHVNQPNISDRVCTFFVDLANASPVLAVFLKILLINPAMELVFAISIIRFVRERKNAAMSTDMCLFLIYSICAIIIGIIMYLVINAGASSEKYFVMATFIVGALFCAHIYSLFEDKHIGVEWLGEKMRSTITVISIVLFAACFIRFAWTENTAVELKSVLVGIRNVYYSNFCPDRIVYDMQTVTSEDAKALYWVRDNTPKDAIILSDKAVLTGDDDYYLYGLFTERQQFIEGTKMLGDHRERINREINRRKEIVRGFYSDNTISIEELCDEGITYILRTRDLTPSFSPSLDGISRVYTSDSIEVYKVEKKG